MSNDNSTIEELISGDEPGTIIDSENFEESNAETQSEEDTSEKVDYSKKQMIEKQRIRTSSESEVDEESDLPSIEENAFNEAVKKYYRLKNEYDESLQNQKKKILAMSGLSLKEKSMEFRKLKRKCVNCKRPVGSIFNTKVEGYELIQYKDRHLIALCGDRDNPCPLNIDINLGATNDIRSILNGLEKELNDLKNQVIKDKNDLLFGYINSQQAIEKFDEIKENIKMTNELYDLYFQNYNQIVDNPKKKEELQTLLKGFYENVDSLKSMIQEYENSNDTQYVIDAVELYKNEIMPKSEKIMHKTYKYNGVDYEDDNNTYHLDQKKYTLQQFEIDAGEQDHSIINMKLGMPQKIKPTAATRIQERIPALRIGQNQSSNPRQKPKLVLKESLNTESEDEDE
jgi:hypothetical protein